MRVLLAAVLLLSLSMVVAPPCAVAQVPGAQPLTMPELPSLGGDKLPPVDTTGISYSEQPDANVIPALEPFRGRNATFHYMGRTAGLDGWFMTMPDNFIQIAYTSVDGNQLIIGFIVGAKGKNITEQQLVNLRERDEAVNKLFTDKVEDAKAKLARDRGFQELMTNLNMDKPGDKLYAEITQAPSVEVGATGAPLLLMVLDPQCPFCKQAWRKLQKDFVSEDKLLVRLVPVAILGDDSMRMAELLLDKDGQERWQAYADSDFDKTKLVGEAGPEGKKRYAVNAALYNRWKLKGTPFFAYRSKDGTIKVLNELPKDWDALVKDIAPAQAVTLPK